MTSRTSASSPLVLGVLLTLAGAWPAAGGVIDSPLPVLQLGAATQHVYTVPGVIKNNWLETIFMCTSLDTSGDIVVGVEVFGALGGSPLNLVGTPDLDGAETISPGETATIATGNTVGFHEDEIIDSLLPASLRNGSARILSTSKRITCSAFVVDELNDPPTTMGALKLISKKQRGD